MNTTYLVSECFGSFFQNACSLLCFRFSLPPPLTQTCNNSKVYSYSISEVAFTQTCNTSEVNTYNRQISEASFTQIFNTGEISTDSISESSLTQTCNTSEVYTYDISETSFTQTCNTCKVYGVVLEGLLTFLGFLFPGRDFRSSLNSGSHKKKFSGVFVTASDDFFVGFIWKKNVCAIPVLVMKDQYQPE